MNQIKNTLDNIPVANSNAKEIIGLECEENFYSWAVGAMGVDVVNRHNVVKLANDFLACRIAKLHTLPRVCSHAIYGSFGVVLDLLKSNLSECKKAR